MCGTLDRALPGMCPGSHCGRFDDGTPWTFLRFRLHSRLQKLPADKADKVRSFGVHPVPGHLPSSAFLRGVERGGLLGPVANGWGRTTRGSGSVGFPGFGLLPRAPAGAHPGSSVRLCPFWSVPE